jgi:hypothetical protein
VGTTCLATPDMRTFLHEDLSSAPMYPLNHKTVY